MSPEFYLSQIESKLNAKATKLTGQVLKNLHLPRRNAFDDFEKESETILRFFKNEKISTKNQNALHRLHKEYKRNFLTPRER